MRQKDEWEEGERWRCRGINHSGTMCQTKDKSISCSPLGDRLLERDEKKAWTTRENKHVLNEFELKNRRNLNQVSAKLFCLC